MYSNCYEYLGMFDSAVTCLVPALYNFERYQYPTEVQFFRLANEKYARNEVIDELRIALLNIREIDYYMCAKYYVEFKGIKVGLDETDVEMDVKEMFEKLKKKYFGYQ